MAPLLENLGYRHSGICGAGHERIERTATPFHRIEIENGIDRFPLPITRTPDTKTVAVCVFERPSIFWDGICTDNMEVLPPEVTE